jgi:hypothetical protein
MRQERVKTTLRVKGPRHDSQKKSLQGSRGKRRKIQER